MKLIVFAVRDSAVEAFLSPFFCRTANEAIRSFREAVGDKRSPFCINPGDYGLFRIGTFDDGSGELVSEPPRVALTAMQARSDAAQLEDAGRPADALIDLGE